LGLSKVKKAFEPSVVVLPTNSIAVQREISSTYRKTTIYKQIAASIKHVGLIEPLIVFPRAPNDYLLLDGHIRLDILKNSGANEVRAIFATDDEAYTYNRRVNHAPPIAQHFMILKALSNGVTEERIATALNTDVAGIKKKRDMLDGICPEAVEILRNSHITAPAFAVLKKMKPVRQIEAAEHMTASGTFTVPFVKALLEVTRPEFLLELPSKRKLEADSAAVRAMFEEETDSLIRDLKAVEESYGTDILTLSIACGYITRFLANGEIERHLQKRHPEILSTLRSLLAEVKPEKTNIAEN
jgi:RepB plasmid partitioning protein/ParB-like nuclease domain